MKTINSDLGVFLKRLTASNANVTAPMTLMHDGKVFIVKCGDASTRSQYLDAALENLAESMRRSANNMKPVRETKPEPVVVTVSLTNPAPTSTYVPPFTQIPSISQAGQQAYQQQVSLTCPKCNTPPDVMAGFNFDEIKCRRGHQWPASDGIVYTFDNGERFIYRASGAWLTGKWIKQP